MTNNQLTSTHLAVKSELDGYKIHASRGQATAMAMVRLFESIDRDLEELQERRLAAMDSEPVAWTWHYREQWHVTSDKGRAAFVAIDGDVAVLPLYRHAQQPVVPDESYQQLSELYHAQEKRLFKIARRIKGPAFDKYSHTPSQAIDVLEGAIFGEDDACRAAMLAAAPQSPGSEPATAPGKWIPVSERMPETDGNYWGWWSESKRQGPVWFIKSELQAQFQSSEITHWMPLPAAPQEVKGE
ncbi:DUF551 domain-containing protein [Klebsiella pneumoniae]